jgi:hypothetical protein
MHGCWMHAIVNFFELQEKIPPPIETHEKQETRREIYFVGVILCKVSDSLFWYQTLNS